MKTGLGDYMKKGERIKNYKLVVTKYHVKYNIRNVINNINCMVSDEY